LGPHLVGMVDRSGVIKSVAARMIHKSVADGRAAEASEESPMMRSSC
jgi:hypothetical protein